MQLCLICTEKLPVPPIRGGAIQTYLDAVAPRLAAHHAVTLICRSDPLLPDREEVGGVRFVRLPAPNAERYFAEVAAFLRAAPPFDLIELFNRPAYADGILAAAPGARLMLSLHNEMLAPDRLEADQARAILGQAAWVVTISDYVRREIERLYPAYGPKLRTIRSGVDTARFRPIWEGCGRRAWLRRQLGLRGRQVVLHVSRLSPKKGNHLVIAAMEQLRKSHPQAALLLVGSSRYGSQALDSYGQMVMRRAREGLGPAVRSLGFVPPVAIPDLFLASDLFICASQWPEPLARVHYEAMAAGLPIITTDRGGNGEVMEEGGTGLIARPYDQPEGFAQAICQLLDDPGLRLQMGHRGRRLVEEAYTWDRVAKELLELIAGRDG